MVWYRVRNAAGAEEVHRWAANADPHPERLTLDQYHAQEGMTLIAGPFKTRKQAIEFGK